MRAIVLALVLVVLGGKAVAQAPEPRITEADVRKAEESLRKELRGPLLVYIIDSPREPFLRGVEFERIVLLAERPFYRFRSVSARDTYWLLDPSHIFSFAVEGPPRK
jgi:hypothetical protein